MPPTGPVHAHPRTSERKSPTNATACNSQINAPGAIADAHYYPWSNQVLFATLQNSDFVSMCLFQFAGQPDASNFTTVLHPNRPPTAKRHVNPGSPPP